jgi:hypothetical protein
LSLPSFESWYFIATALRVKHWLESIACEFHEQINYTSTYRLSSPQPNEVLKRFLSIPHFAVIRSGTVVAPVLEASSYKSGVVSSSQLYPYSRN